jgi:Flp pilus assembly protein TadG
VRPRSSRLQPAKWAPRDLVRTICHSEAAELIEFAVSLPLLVVFVVGIFDFGSAFTLKQKLATISLEAARVASNQPSNDLSNPSGTCSAPSTICIVRDIVDNALIGNHVNDCGLSGTTATLTSTLVWTFSSTGTCSGQFTLTIERGLTYSSTLPDPFTSVYTNEATRVTINYPYQWQFSRVVGLLVPGANYAGPSQLMSLAVMQNLN